MLHPIDRAMRVKSMELASNTFNFTDEGFFDLSEKIYNYITGLDKTTSNIEYYDSNSLLSIETTSTQDS